MKKLISITIALIVCFSLLMLVGTENAVAQKTYNWVWQISAPSGTPYMTCAEDMAERIEKATDNRIKIDVHAGGSIVKSHDVTQAVKSGVLDCASPNPSMDLGRFGPKVLLLGGSGFPGGPKAQEFLAWAYKDDGLNYAKKIYGDYGVEAIGWVTVAPPELFCHSKEKIENIEDIEGIKFRTMGLWGEIMESLGASVVTVSGGEIYQSMDRGVVDAFEYCGPGVNWDSGYQEIAEFIGVPGIHSPLSTNVFIVNSNTWNELPADLKQIVSDEVMAASLLDFLEFANGDVIGYQKFKEYGTEEFELSDNLQKEIAERTYEQCLEYAKEDEMFKEIFEDQMEYLKKWSALMTSQEINYQLHNMHE